jgi:hypothetical protein
MSQIIKEIHAIKKCIAGKKEKFQKSHLNFVELNKILGRSLDNIKPNLLLELTAHEVLSDMKFLEIIGDVFKVDMVDYIKSINNDFQTYNMPLEIEILDIENFDEIKEIIAKYLADLRAYYLNKFKTIQDVMNKQDSVDIDEIANEFKIIERITQEKLDVNEKSLAKLEKKYGEILVYVKNKISN